MKKLLLFICVTPFSFYAQSNTFPTSGDVGIGTTNPNSPLHLSSGFDGILTFQTSDDSWLYTNWKDNTGTRKIWMGLDKDLTSFNIALENGANKILLRGGNVGIGTMNPLDKLQVGEGITFHSGGHKVIGFSYAPTGAVDLDETEYSGEIRFDPSQGQLMLGVSPSITSKPSTRLIIQKNGNVGIATTNPGNWTLAVNGKIRAKEIKVDTGWSDFVFEENYKLPSLKEVEQHIKEKGHLKDIPSAKEVAENGIFLGAMDAKLLQKIEELTLYTIQQEKQMHKQDERIAIQQKQIEMILEENRQLRRDIEELKKAIE